MLISIVKLHKQSIKALNKMEIKMNIIKIIPAATIALCMAGGFSMASEKGIFTEASEVNFEDIIPGTVAFGTVAGDRADGAHGTFVRIPPGQATPLHTHGAAYHAVVIEGKFENPIDGDADSQVTLGKGSYYYVPAGAAHITRCAADSPVDCLTYFHQDVSFDFAPVE